MKKFTLANFMRKIRDPQQRKYFCALFGGKILGVSLCFLVMLAVSLYMGSLSKAHAQTSNAPPRRRPLLPERPARCRCCRRRAGAHPPNPPYVNPINTMWVLVTAFLVFFMQAGFMFLRLRLRTRGEASQRAAGRHRGYLPLLGILFYIWGFAWMFGHGNGIIGWGDGAGHSWYCLQNLPDTYESTGVAAWHSSFSNLPSPTPAPRLRLARCSGRTGFELGRPLAGRYSIGVSGFLYPIFGHWAWGQTVG